MLFNACWISGKCTKKRKILNILWLPVMMSVLELLFDFYRETPTEQIFYHCGSKAHLSDRKIEERSRRDINLPLSSFSAAEMKDRSILFAVWTCGEFCNLFGLNAIANRFLDLLKRKWEKVKKITALLAWKQLRNCTLLQNSSIH